MKYLERDIEDEFGQLVSYRAELIDESFSHCLGNESVFTIDLEDNQDVLVEDEIMHYDDLTANQRLLVQADLMTLSKTDFEVPL